MPVTRKPKQKSNSSPTHSVQTYGSVSDYIHKEFPLDDEELSCRHSAETLVGCDEEEGTHPIGGTQTFIQKNLFFIVYYR